MPRELVPELHDIMKMTKCGHVYIDFPFLDKAPDTPTWEGITKHHISRDFELFPDSSDTFILCVADSLASAISRPSLDAKDEDKGAGWSVKKLWNPQEEADPRLHDEQEIVELMEFLNTDPSKEEFFSRYSDILTKRSEDANAGKNITSLFTHLILTGQFYRVLKSCYEIRPAEVSGKKPEEVWQVYNEFYNRKCKLVTVACKFHFNQKPYRIVDLNIFIRLEQVLNEISQKFPDNIILRTSNELLLVYPDMTIEDKLKKLLEGDNFWLEIALSERELNNLEPNPNLIEKGRLPLRRNIYFELEQSIEPPLCEICQMAKATNIWKPEKEAGAEKLGEEEEPGIERLCDACYSIRSMGARLKKLKDWTEEGDAKVAWVKLSLNFNDLIITLENLNKNYLDQLKIEAKVEDIKIRFSVISEFQRDYDLFIEEYSSTVKEEFNIANVETILSDFHCIKITKNRDILKVLEIYNNLLFKYFPKFVDIEKSPLRLTIVGAGSKFPFFEVWRLIEQSDEDVNISLIGHGAPIKTKNRALEQILLADKPYYRKSALHNLAEIAKISESLAKLKFKDRSDRKDYPTYKSLEENLANLMDYRSILTFAKLLED